MKLLPTPLRKTLLSLLNFALFFSSAGLAQTVESNASASPSFSDERQKEASGDGLSAKKSLSFLIPGDGMAIDLLGSEPDIQQPAFLRFDERGRMWVVQYRQYPVPAGLEIISRDEYWRNTYNRVPTPPGDPDFVPGADKITIHEDTNGDGTFDKVTPFLEGLNLATSLAWDRDGVWVLQPPYLLFYEDKDKNDRVDGPPKVHLSGFGIQDSHSICSSLTWGPDGWLYGAQGSTVTAAVEVVGSGAPPVKSVGQLMWRYHPKKRVYEIFSEGGGNIWSCQFDSKGRLFAGTNEGGKLGYHYMQGAYNKKWFSKHGELSNPNAYGYFLGVEDPDAKRVTTNLMIYEEGILPERYGQAILTINALTGRVLASRLVPRGPSFRAEFIDLMIDSEDRWFRPVYADVGPDGAVYVADWYDRQVNHYKNHEGQISIMDGRVYRVRNGGEYKAPMINLSAESTDDLVELFKHEQRWYRNTARRLINERQDVSVLPKLKQWLAHEKGQAALESLWAINLLGGFDEGVRKSALNHPNPFVRKWAIRLIGDQRTAYDWELKKLVELAASDPYVEIRQQLASSAKRLPSGQGLFIVRELLARNEDAVDSYMPLLIWWALESFCSSDVEAVLEMFKDRSLFDQALVQKPILEYVMRRLAAEGTRKYLRACAQMLKLAPDSESKATLLKGFEEAYRGRSMTGFPVELVSELSKAGGGSLALQIRQQIPEAIRTAGEVLANSSVGQSERRRIIEALGEVPQASILPVLLAQLEETNPETQEVVLSALRSYNDPAVAKAVIRFYPEFSKPVLAAAQTLLMSRPAWSRQWLESVYQGQIPKDLIPADIVETFRRLNDSGIGDLIAKIWVDPTSTDAIVELDDLRAQLESSALHGDPYKGREYYISRCSACHILHDEGFPIGPDLTGYQRQDFDSLWLAISNPNAEIREGYENVVVRTHDGQILSGFIADKDEHVLVLRPVGGQPIVIEQSKIESLESAGVSMMPEGLLAGLNEQALVDLFTYLRSSQPLNVK